MRRTTWLLVLWFAAACAAKPTPPGVPPDLPDVEAFPRRSAKMFETLRCDPATIQRGVTEYPPEAKAQRVEGWVIVSGLVDPGGRVRDPIVLAAKPEGVFDQAALDAFSRSRFCAPDPRDSAPELRTLIQFQLDE